MNALASTLAYRKAIGIYISDREVLMSEVAATPFGPVVTMNTRVPYERNEQADAIETLLQPFRGSARHRRRLVTIGLPTDALFFVTRPIRLSDSDTPPQELLREVLQSATISVDEMVVDLVKAKQGQRLVASIVACNKKYLTGWLGALKKCGGVRVLRAEPAPCGLLRVAAQERRISRRANTSLRIFLGRDRGLAVVSSADVPLCWRTFALQLGDEASAILSIVRVLQTLAKHYGIDSTFDAVVLHAREDLSRCARSLEEQVGMRVFSQEGVGLDESAIAYGLALGGLDQGDKAFDLARTLKQRPSVRELFPWGEVALQLALLLCVGLMLMEQLNGLRRAHAAVKRETSQREWMASVSEAALLKEKKELEQQVNAIRSFLSSRIVWTDFTYDIATRLPGSAALTSFNGICELKRQSKRKGNLKPKKSLVLRATVPIPSDGSMPHEIDQFLDNLNDDPLLQRDFPIVEVADIKRYQPFIGAQPVAHFTVVCLPGTGKRKK